MTITYADKPTKVRPYMFPDWVLTEIGKLIRAYAEIEDIATLHLTHLAGITERHVAVLLGRTALSQKLRMLEVFSEASGNDAVTAFKESFETERFKAMIRCRNAVAHGLLLGLTDDDRVAFRISELVGANAESAQLGVQSYSETDIKNFAQLAISAIPYLEDRLQLKALRETRRQRPLDPHRKAKSQAKKGAKPSRPRKASQA